MKRFSRILALTILILFALVSMAGATASLFNYPKFHGQTSTGTPLAGGLVYTYAPGTSTPKATYSDLALTTPNTNPIVMDSNGDATIYFNGQYKVVLKTSAGVTVWTMDNVGGIESAWSGYEVDALNTYGGGSAYTQATIATALTAIGTTNKTTLLLRPGTWTITADADYSAYTNVTWKIVPGALISVASGKLLTLMGPIDAGLYQIFSGAGTVVFGSSTVGATHPMIDKIYPQWWGALANEVHDDTAAIQAACDAVPYFSWGGYTVYFPPGVYKVTKAINIKTRRMLLKGPGALTSNAATLKNTTDPNEHIIDYTTNGTDTLSIEGLQFWGALDAVGAGTGSGVVLGDVSGTGWNSIYSWHITDCWFVYMPQAAIYIKNGDDGHISNNGIEQNSYGILLEGGQGQLKISNNTITHNAYNGIKIVSPVVQPPLLVNSANTIITGNSFTTNGKPSSAAESSAIILVTSAGEKAIRNTLIASNVFDHNYRDIIVQGGTSVIATNTGIINTQIIGNSSDYCDNESITVSGAARTLVSANKLHYTGYGAAAPVNAVSVTGTSFDTVIDGNVNYYDTTAPTAYGLFLGATTVDTVLGLNDFRGNSGDIDIDTGATYSLMHQGAMASVAKIAVTAFSNSWANYGGAAIAAGYYKTADGIVHLTGTIKSGTSTLVAFALPAGYRPAGLLYQSVYSAGADAFVAVSAGGDVTPFTSDNSLFCLDGVSFIGQ
jgi:hypothetical protein